MGVTSLAPDRNVFAGLSNVLDLFLSGNQLSMLPANAFAGLSNLQSLWFNDNKISTLQFNALAGLSKLQTLSFLNNQLTTLPANTFANLSSLQALFMSPNHISSLPANIFAGLNIQVEIELDSPDLCLGGVPVYIGQWFGVWRCNLCSAGTYSYPPSTVCTSCPKGTFSSTGSSNCTSCGAGSYSAVQGLSSSAACLPCAVGSYSGASSSACLTCGAGTYATMPGASACAASALPTTSLPHPSNSLPPSALPTTSLPPPSNSLPPSALPTTSLPPPSNSLPPSALPTTSLPPSASSDPYAVSSSGFQILQSYYNSTCLAHGCWVVDIEYSKSDPSYAAVVYLPRESNVSDASAFPCTTKNLQARSATTCCLQDFVSNYRPISTFTASSGTCDSKNPPTFAGTDAIYGQFGSGMPNSQVIPLGGGTTTVLRARLLLDHNEILAHASKLVPGTAVGVDATVQLFIGMAQFSTVSPTSQILDSSNSQIALTLQKASYFTVTSSGTNAYTFLSHFNLVVNEALDSTDPTKKSQYITATYALNSNYQPGSGGIVPLTSVRVGNGTASASAQWIQSCETPVSSDYSARLNQACGPQITTCTSNYDSTQQFGSFNIPLRDANQQPLFNLNNAASLQNQNIFVQLVLSVQSNGQPVTTSLSASLPLQQGGVDTWCYANAYKTSLESVVNGVSIMVGTASNASDFAALSEVDGIQKNGTLSHTVLNQLNSKSIESGLITLAVQGGDAYFQLSGNTGYSLVVEDVYTVHMMGSAAMSNVVNLMGLGSVMNIVTDVVNQKATLSPSVGLTSMCTGAQPLPASSCVIRHDMQNGVPVTQSDSSLPAFEVVTSDTNFAAAGTWMKSVTGTSDFSTTLGSTFAGFVAGKFGLTSRKYKRAFWINPGYVWTGVQASQLGKFTLSQNVILFALIRLNEGTSSRRVLLTSQSSSVFAGGASAGVQYGVSPATLLADAQGVPQDHSSTWSISMSISAQNACSETTTQLTNGARSLLLGGLKSFQSVIQDIEVSAVTVHLNGLDCSLVSSSRRQAAGAPYADFETIILFKAGTTPSITKSDFLSVANIQTVTPISVPPAILASFNGAGTSSAGSTAASSSGGTPGWSTGMIAGIAVAAAAVVLLAGCGGCYVLAHRAAPAPALELPKTVDFDEELGASNALKASLGYVGAT